MIWWIIAILIYIAVVPFAYKKLYDSSNSAFENFWFAIIWPLMLLGWIMTGCKQ